MPTWWKDAVEPRPASAVRRLRQSEKAFRQQVLALARLRKWRAYWTWTSIHSPAGMPDLVLVRPPRLIFAELKTDHARPTEEQQAWLDALAACPACEAYLWRPAMWDEIQQVLT
jgi:hypothetical protein